MDKKEVLKQIKAGDLYLGNADKKLKADKEIVLVAVKKYCQIRNTFAKKFMNRSLLLKDYN